MSSDNNIYSTDTSPKQSTADYLIDAAKKAYTFFYDDQSYVAFGDDSILPVNSSLFRNFLANWYYQQTKRTINYNTLKSVIAVLDSHAQFEGTPEKVFTRIGYLDATIYLDLAGDSAEVVRLSRDGWQVIRKSDCPLRFHCNKGIESLPRPCSGSKIDILRHLLNVNSNDDLIMIAAWVIGALNPFAGGYPILTFSGQQGSGKTYTSRMLRSLIDPNTLPSRAMPESERDLMIAAKRAWVINFDNLSYIRPGLSDALCRLSTGGGIGTRMLYTSDDEIVFNAKRPMILNGINDPAVRPDLLSRTIQVNLPAIRAYRTEREMDERFKVLHPSVLGALLDFVVAALANRDTNNTACSRLADFEQWITAAEHNPNRPDWWKLGDFNRAYRASLDSGDAIALAENAVIVEPLKVLIATSSANVRFQPDKPVWSGTPTDLLKILATIANKEPRELAAKANPSAFTRRLNRLIPSLETIGIKIVNHKNRSRIEVYQNAIPNGRTDCENVELDRCEAEAQSPAGIEEFDASDYFGKNIHLN